MNKEVSAFNEYAAASQVPIEPTQDPKLDAPHLPSPDSPVGIDEITTETPKEPVYKDKIIERPVYKEKVITKKRIEYEPIKISLSGPLYWVACFTLGLCALYLFGLLYNGLSGPSASPAVKEKIVYKTKQSVKWKTRWKTKTKVVEKPVEKIKVVYREDQGRIKELQKRIKYLEGYIESYRTDPYDLHKKAIKGYFKGIDRGKAGSLRVRVKKAYQ